MLDVIPCPPLDWHEGRQLVTMVLSDVRPPLALQWQPVEARLAGLEQEMQDLHLASTTSAVKSSSSCAFFRRKPRPTRRVHVEGGQRMLP
jgi:hypothetical protein